MNINIYLAPLFKVYDNKYRTVMVITSNCIRIKVCIFKNFILKNELWKYVLT